MKRFLIIAAVWLALMPLGRTQQQEETVSVPKSQLTDQQKAQLHIDAAKSYVGIGKEIGDAVNTSLQAVTAQSNNFAQTPVGKLTVFVVIWKVLGQDAIHILGAIGEVLLFVPIWLWSFRRMCFTRSLRTGKETWQVFEYKRNTVNGEISARTAHLLVAVGIVAVIGLTAFAY